MSSLGIISPRGERLPTVLISSFNIKRVIGTLWFKVRNEAQGDARGVGYRLLLTRSDDRLSYYSSKNAFYDKISYSICFYSRVSVELVGEKHCVMSFQFSQFQTC